MATTFDSHRCRQNRRYAPKFGKTFIRSMSDFLGRQSLVPDTPVLDPGLFGFTKMLEADWQVVREKAERCWIQVEDQTLVWGIGKTLVFCDGYDHEVWYEADEERTVLLVQFDRPMRLPGRLFSKAFVALLKLTAFYKEPRKNMVGFEDRFEAATKRANAALEKMSD